MSRGDSARRRQGRVHWPDWVLWLLLSLLAVPTARFAWELLTTDLAVLQARQQMLAWSQPSTPMRAADWVTARNRVTQALEAAPDNPTLHDLLASLYVMRARQSTQGSAFQTSLYATAAQHQRAALALRPGHGWTWAGLAESLLVPNPQSPEGWAAWRQALKLAPHEVLVQYTLYRVGQPLQEHAPPDVLVWLQQTRQTPSVRLRKMLGLPLLAS